MMQEITKCEFSTNHYRQILDNIKDRCGTASEKKEIILTHDIDILPLYALRMAILEYKQNIKSTYYIFLHSNMYNALSPENMDIWKKIKSFGHELAFHYDTRYDQRLLLVPHVIKSLIGEIDNINISQHFVDLSPKPIIPDYLIDRRSFVEQGYHYIADSGGWFRDGCFCKNIDKYEKILIVCHPIWWMVQSFYRAYADANVSLRGAIKWWEKTLNEHRKQAK